jgi:hypothetical protein
MKTISKVQQARVQRLVVEAIRVGMAAAVEEFNKHSAPLTAGEILLAGSVIYGADQQAIVEENF